MQTENRGPESGPDLRAGIRQHKINFYGFEGEVVSRFAGRRALLEEGVSNVSSRHYS